MCLIVLAHRMHPAYPLVLAANRDEFHARPTAPAAFWPGAPQVLAGRDLQAGGTWLGVSRQGRWAALTNVREAVTPAGRPSRGLLVSDFLRGNRPPVRYLEQVARRGWKYAGFNLLAGDGRQLASLSNRDAGVKLLAPGCYGLSNRLLDTPWPKVEQAKRQMVARLLHSDFHPDQLWQVLADRGLPPARDLPDSGLDRSVERALGAIFVQLPGYGTRCSTLLTIGRDRRVCLAERRFGPDGHIEGESRFAFFLPA